MNTVGGKSTAGHGDAAASAAGFGTNERRAVRRELERVLASAAFRGSKRCQEFLRYIVDAGLAEQPGAPIKERTLGIALFGRDADYDTSEDSVVRVTANEVRKRLAQHYREAGAGAEVTIDLPPGSYYPQFAWTQAAGRPAARPPRWRGVAAGAAVAAAVAALVWGLSREPRLPPQFEEFWRPFIKQAKPVLLVVSNPVVYQLSGSIVAEFGGPGSQDQVLPPEPVRLPPGIRVPASGIVPVTNQYTGIGDAAAAVQYSAFLARRGKEVQFRGSGDATFTELRDSPVILSGGTNRWTPQFNERLHFRLAKEEGRWTIREKSGGSRRWQAATTGDGVTLEDYVVVARLFDSQTGGVVLVGAGLTQYGCQAAAEFVTNPKTLTDALKTLPPAWKDRNVEFVLKIAVVGKTPGAPAPVASHSW